MITRKIVFLNSFAFKSGSQKISDPDEKDVGNPPEGFELNQILPSMSLQRELLGKLCFPLHLSKPGRI
jgi:hypothetical protein